MAATFVSTSSEWEGDTHTHDQVVAHGERRSLVRAKVVEVVGLAGERGVNMVDDRLRDSRRVWRVQSVSDPTRQPCKMNVERVREATGSYARAGRLHEALERQTMIPVYRLAISGSERRNFDSPVVSEGMPSFHAFSSPTGHFSLPVASVSGV